MPKNPLQSTFKLSDFGGFRRLSLFWIAAVLGMAALLVTVAVLQYRWTSQITEATETRIGNNVESLMLDWHLDFYQQFSSICVALQVGPDSGEHEDWLAYRGRYSIWTRAVVHPRLVEILYVWETSQRSVPRLLRMGTGQAQLLPVDPPEKLARLLRRLQERSQNIGEALGAWELVKGGTHQVQGNNSSSWRGNPLTGWQFDQGVPAIVHPIIHHPLGGEDRVRGRAVDWIVLVLDMAAIRDEVLPAVTKKYTANGQYELSVGVGGSANGLIYSSGADASSLAPAHTDATMNIFGPPPESTEGYFWQAFKNGNSLTGLEWHDFSGPVWFPVFQYGTQEQPWTLILRNQNGPLLATVARLRRRNLITEALILFLLLASMSLVAVATHRAQRLAKLEMEFVASVSHELRTPLSAILSAGENIADGLIDGKKALIRYGSIITNQSTQLIDMVDQVLLFAGTRDGSKRYQFTPLRMEEVLQSVRQNVAGSLQVTGCWIEQLLGPDLPYILGDRSAVTRCLQNLVTNAIKYSPQNCKVVIAAEVYESEAGAKELRIHVRDQGVGISTSELPHIFKAFYRGPRVVAAQIHGTGLGLALAKGIAEAMGGRLTVVGEVGKGSTFTLHLPVPRQQDFDDAVFYTAQGVSQE